MSTYRVVDQRFFVKGANSAQSTLNQLPGTIPRISNLLYTTRGAMKTTDGSLILSAYNGAIQSGMGPLTDILLYLPSGASSSYVAIAKDYATHLAVPTTLAASDGGAGGSFSNVAYYFVVTALDGAGGETPISNEATVTPTLNHKINLTWTAVTNAAGYRVYMNTSPGTEVLLNVKPTTNSITLLGSESVTGGSPPTINTTQVCQFYSLPASSYSGANIIATLPADLIPILNYGDYGGYGGGGASKSSGSGGTTSASTGAGATPTGGVSGNCSPLPQLLNFTSKVILCLGNGTAPRTWDGSSFATITNTFTSSYPAWTANTLYTVGDYVVPTVANGHIFKVTQSGTSGAAEPTWPTSSNQAIANGGVIFTEAGSDTGGPAPPGAAHGIVHAGALWVANTSPSNTSNGLDGPSALRMSDINNPKSWNPINAAFINRDDGTQITGLATFSIAEAGIPPTQSLVVFKEFSTFMVTGVFGSSNFAIQQAQTDLGCIAPRSIQFVPGFGIVRLTHLGIAVFDGVRDRIISEEIRPFLFDDPNDDITAIDWNFAYFSKGAQTATPPMYVMACPLLMATLSGVVASTIHTSGGTLDGNYYVKVTKLTSLGETAISPEFGPFGMSPGSGITMKVVIPTATDAVKWRIYYGAGSGNETQYLEYTEAQIAALGRVVTWNTTGSSGTPGGGLLSRLFCYDLVLKAWTIVDLPFGISVLKQMRAPGTIPITIVGGYNDGTFRRMFAGDVGWEGTPINWSFRTAEVFGESASSRTYFRRVFVRGYVPSGTASLTITSTVNGQTGPTITPAKVVTLGAGQFQVELGLGFTGLNAHLDISGTGLVTIEEASWHVQPRPTGTPVSV